MEWKTNDEMTTIIYDLFFVVFVRLSLSAH